jgi:putative ABC transport system permease protein
VTSLRSTDSRSGLPFFYFVLSPQDVANFPGTYFGYAYYDASTQQSLSKFLATDEPNISVIATQAIGPLILKILNTLMIMVLVVTLPPLLVATLLIATLVVSSFAARRREGARLRALGASQSFVLRQYLAESVSLTLAAAVLAYLLGIVITYGVSHYYLKLDSVVFFDAKLLLGLGLIVVLVVSIALYLFKTDKMPLRELLSYGENN